jgi:hypothetical protein
VVVYVQLGRAMSLLHDVLGLVMEKEHETEGRAILDKVFEILNLSALGPVYAASTWRDGVAVGVGYTELDPAAGGICSLMRPRPIDLAALQAVPKDALGVSLSSFELAPLWDLVMEGLKQAAPEIHERVVDEIRKLETKAAGADAEGRPNWDIRRDLVGALAGRMMAVTTPGTGSMFGPGGDSVLSIETPDPRGLEKSLDYVWAMIGELAARPIKFKEQFHGDAKLHVLDPMSLGQVAMLAGSLQLTYAVFDDRIWFATSTKALKKALDARATPPAENITSNPDFAARYVAPPEGAVLTSLSYNATARNFENAYSAVLGVLPMAMMGLQQGGMGELPIDMALLPTGETISKHLFGTVEMSYRVGERGHVTISRGPFGAETGLAIAAGAGAVGSLVMYRMEQAKSNRRRDVSVRIEKAETSPPEKARNDLAEINSAITVYMIVNDGRPPASLDELVRPTADYPDGFLGRNELPTDPWGRVYAYKVEGAEQYVVWSFGPDGVDDGGTGDDIVQRN